MRFHPAISYSIFFLLIISTLIFSESFKKASTWEPVAVIELFTSQGCSSCPPADEVLSKTIADTKSTGKKIFSLSFHVDYWNRLGWIDPFSDKKYSDRQAAYASRLNPGNIYTPQMIVNGEWQFVGSDRNLLINALQDGLRRRAPAAFTKLDMTQVPGKPFHVEFKLAGNYAGCEIRFALISLKESTNVKRGENGGRRLESENIVRQLVSMKAVDSGAIDFASSPAPAFGNAAVIAYLQHMPDLKIIGAAKAINHEDSE